MQGDGAHHLLHVLRMKEGARVTLCDGQSTDYPAILREADRKKMLCHFTTQAPAPCETELRLPIALYQSLPKGDKFEAVIQKCVELGVFSILPVYTAHSLAKNADKKTARYQKIAEAAAGQSMRGIVPQVHLPATFAQALAQAEKTALHLIALSPSEAPADFTPRTLREILSEAPRPCAISLWIGPEGGFSPQEVTALLDVGAIPFTFGKRVLRTETAAPAALAQISCLLE